MVKKSPGGPLWVIGWREWLALPQLGIEAIKVKIDTGARSSALHAFDVEPFRRGGRSLVRFQVHPLQRDDLRAVQAEAELVDLRTVRNSGGQVEQRPVILTQATIRGRIWSFELTLTNRDEMGFRMLLGRQAVRGRFLIDPSRSFLTGKPSATKRRRRPKRGAS